jgi:hypothetical protein
MVNRAYSILPPRPERIPPGIVRKEAGDLGLVKLARKQTYQDCCGQTTGKRYQYDRRHDDRFPLEGELHSELQDADHREKDDKSSAI